jgi:hypothetical protein
MELLIFDGYKNIFPMPILNFLSLEFDLNFKLKLNELNLNIEILKKKNWVFLYLL